MYNNNKTKKLRPTRSRATNMKKLIVMLFVATSLLAVSCKKDTTVKLTGTQWVGKVTIGEFNGSYIMSFLTDSTGKMDVSLRGGGEDEDYTQPFTYTFDGKETGVLNIDDDIADTFHYSAENSTITMFLSPEEAEEMTISCIVFHKK